MTSIVVPPTITNDASLGDLRLVLKANYPIIAVSTSEEARARSLLAQLFRERAIPTYFWTSTDGLVEAKGGAVVGEQRLESAEDALRYIKNETIAAGYVLFDLHPHLIEPRVQRLLKDIAQHHEELPRHLVLVSVDIELPQEIAHLATKVQLSLPSRKEVEQIIHETASEWLVESKSEKLRVSRRALKLLIQALTGLPTTDVRRLARRVIFEDGEIANSDVKQVLKYREELIGNEGTLTFELDIKSPEALGGFATLKEWLERRGAAFTGDTTATQQKLEPPRGIMLVGVQGCGKSLAAKTVAGLWSVPLLRFDVGTLLNKYVGESERNFRRAIEIAEAMEPCVLWMDEIEKGFAPQDDGTGVTRRMLGSLLTWMAERKKAVFLIATANDITILPPELVRKGRFDEIFFVDLPNLEERIGVFKIQLESRNLDYSKLDIAALAAATDGFSGAEIEQLIISATYHCAAESTAISTAVLQREVAATRPLSVTMSEKITALRAWAETRTVNVR